MRRRTFLAASAATLASPSVGRSESKRVLKFIPQSDLAVLDPVWTTAYVTRNHGYMVFDTLYGQTGKKFGYKCTPQMVAGHVIENDGPAHGDGERAMALLEFPSVLAAGAETKPQASVARQVAR